MKWGRSTRFVVLGVAVSLSSLAVQQAALFLGTGTDVATYLRLAYCVPPIYVGYSRWVLRDVLISERAQLGGLRTEGRMLVRVASAVGASLLLKTALEPTLTSWLGSLYGAWGAASAAVLGDYTYGPAATYVLLVLFSRGAERSQQESTEAV